MIRLIFVETDAGPMLHGGAPAATVMHKSFDLDLDVVETWLKEPAGTYITRSFVGIEILPNKFAEIQAYVFELEGKLAAAMRAERDRKEATS